MANKIIDAVELIKMVRDGNIPENNRFIFKSTIADQQIEVHIGIKDVAKDGYYLLDDKDNVVSTGWLTNSIIEQVEEVYVDNLQELPIYENIENYNNMSTRANRLAINDLIKAVKQINKKLEGK